MNASTMTAEDRATFEKMSKRIAALIAKAESTTSAEEAGAFMAKAEELMLRHAIDRAKLEQLGKLEKEEIGRVWIPFKGLAKYYWPAMRDGSYNIVRAMGTVGMAVHHGTQSVILYGTATDCEAVRVILESVWRQAKSHWLVWKKLDPVFNSLDDKVPHEHELRFNCSVSFFNGFTDGFARAIKDAQDTVVASDEAGSALVLVDRKAEIDAAMGNLGKGRFQSGYRSGLSGYGAGFAAGREAAQKNRPER